VNNVLIRLYGTSDGIDPRSKDAAQRMILYYNNRGLIGSANVLQWILGGEAMQFGPFVDAKVQELAR
jgi:hypothetical protein